MLTDQLIDFKHCKSLFDDPKAVMLATVHARKSWAT